MKTFISILFIFGSTCSAAALAPFYSGHASEMVYGEPCSNGVCTLTAVPASLDVIEVDLDRKVAPRRTTLKLNIVSKTAIYQPGSLVEVAESVILSFNTNHGVNFPAKMIVVSKKARRGLSVQSLDSECGMQESGTILCEATFPSDENREFWLLIDSN